jgi:putative component of membrane protein insertase Oxa1/YidC/SpoIIIJ protein YidD
MFTTLEDLDTEVNINSVWKTIERIYKCQPKGV